MGGPVGVWTAQREELTLLTPNAPDTAQSSDAAIAEGEQGDMSWIDIAVTRTEGDEMVVGYSSGFAEYIDGPFLCDSVEHYAAPADAGVSRWFGFKVGSWDKGDTLRISGGTWAPFALAQSSTLPASKGVEVPAG